MLEVNCISHEPALEFSEIEIQNLFDLLNKKSSYNNHSGTLDIAFVNPEMCASLHDDFFGDPSITDVMTFPGDPDEDHYGDIAVCPIVAKDVCEENNLTFSAELTLYLVHGWLHLTGLDDQTDEDKIIMREAENELMELIKGSQSLPHFYFNPV